MTVVLTESAMIFDLVVSPGFGLALLLHPRNQLIKKQRDKCIDITLRPSVLEAKLYCKAQLR